MSEDKKRNEEYSLKDSVKRVGMLVPIIKSKRGEIVDGNHRLQECPEFKDFYMTVDRIDTLGKEAIARLTINFCRRKIPVEERTYLFDMIARETGWDPVTITENTGIHVDIVRRFLSPEYKKRDKVHPSPLIETESEEPEGNGSVERGQRSTSGTPQKGVPEKEPVAVVMKEREICPNCGLSLDSSETVTIKGKEVKLCIDCAEEYKLTGTLSMMKLNEGEPQENTSASYADRIPSQRMEFPVGLVKEASMMEIRIAKRLMDLGVGFESHRPFRLQSTAPTFYFPRQNLAVYLDDLPGFSSSEDEKAFAAKKVRSDIVRNAWEQLYGGRAVGISFRHYSKVQEQRAWKELQELLGLSKSR